MPETQTPSSILSPAKAAMERSESSEMSRFLWNLSVGGVVSCRENDQSEWHTLGSAANIAEDMTIWDFVDVLVETVVEKRDKKRGVFVRSTETSVKAIAYPRGNAESVFYCRDPRSPFVEHDYVRIRESNRRRESDLMSQLAGLTSERVSAEKGWRALASNPVFHPLCGMCLAVATDGSRVLLLNEARLQPPFFIAHATNLIGPVTATPIDPQGWDWVRNRKVTSSTGQGQSGRPKGTKSPKTSVQLAEELLERLLKGSA